MNITLKEVIFTAATGTEFKRIKEIYLRGNNIKYLRIPETVMEQIAVDNNKKQRFGKDGKGDRDRPKKKR
jgi:U6 snRNA-associated Sm-like protein LSm4